MPLSLTAGNMIAIFIGSAGLAFNFYNLDRIKKSEASAKSLELFKDQFFVRCNDICSEIKEYERWLDIASHGKTLGADDSQARSKFISIKRDLDSFIIRSLKDDYLSDIIPASSIDAHIDETAECLNGLGEIVSIDDHEKTYQNIAINAHELRNALFDSIMAAKKSILK